MRPALTQEELQLAADQLPAEVPAAARLSVARATIEFAQRLREAVHGCYRDYLNDTARRQPAAPLLSGTDWLRVVQSVCPLILAELLRVLEEQP